MIWGSAVSDRRAAPTPQSPLATLRQIPALVVLERFPVPVLAVAEDGEILFANSAFGEMLGCSAEVVQAKGFREIFHTMPTEESPIVVLRAHADLIVQLAHSDGSTVRANMSRSALCRDDDQFVLAVFQDLTERLWAEEI
jgi:PAS domain S-box-containing protein